MRYGLESERADLRPERADFRPERADIRPERADFRPKRAWVGTNKQMDGPTNKQKKVPLCSIGFCPLRGRCPKERNWNC